MKKAILLISIIALFFAGCKKDDIAEASKVRIVAETIEKGWDYIKINVEYDYPVALEAVSLYLSEKEDMSDANVYECNVEGKKYSVELDSLKAGVAYYYCYEYDNGYEKEKSDKSNLNTVSKLEVVTIDVINIKATTVTFNGSVINSDAANKITERGFCWGTEKNPTIEGNHISNGNGAGNFTSNILNLIPNTKYYVRAYAKTNFGIVYGEDKTFTTYELLLPIITTKEVTNIKATTATCGGNVTSDGNSTVTARGICWSTKPNPTISDNKTTEGSGIGSYSSNLSNLSDNTTYYIRAYATNEKGTSYGEEMSFTTLVFKNETFAINGVTFTMIAVEGGTFKMGAQSSDSGGDNYDSDAYSDESPVHDVTLSSYYIGETEVTQELWEAVMGSNPSYFSGYPQKPVEYVSWNDCQEFITKLNNLTGKNFRLPTEAEWEYAARGGNKSRGYKYSGSNTIVNVAWYTDNSSSTTHDVKTKQANELGIYDMSGNVWELCQDWYGSYSSGSQTNPIGPSSGADYVYRGGSWYFNAEYCRVSFRFDYSPADSSNLLGLRLSLSQ